MLHNCVISSRGKLSHLIFTQDSASFSSQMIKNCFSVFRVFHELVLCGSVAEGSVRTPRGLQLVGADERVLGQVHEEEQAQDGHGHCGRGLLGVVNC